MTRAEQILNSVGDKLTRALRADKPLNLKPENAHAHGFYGFEPRWGKAVGDDWFAFAAEIGRALYPIRGYHFLDLGCNVGGKVPFFAAWGCKRYLGLEQMPPAAAFAKARWANGFIDFHVCDIVKDEWPSGFNAMGITYVFQHVPLDSKREILRKVALSDPDVFILADRSIRYATLEECAAMVEKTWHRNMQSLYPFSELVERLPNMIVVEPIEHLFICKRRQRAPREEAVTND